MRLSLSLGFILASCLSESWASPESVDKSVVTNTLLVTHTVSAAPVLQTSTQAQTVALAVTQNVQVDIQGSSSTTFTVGAVTQTTTYPFSLPSIVLSTPETETSTTAPNVGGGSTTGSTIVGSGPNEANGADSPEGYDYAVPGTNPTLSNTTVIPSPGGIGTEPPPSDGWRDTTVTWYANSSLSNPACYNGATQATTNHTGTAPAWKQPSNDDLVAAIVFPYHYTACYDYIQIATNFIANGTALNSVVVRVVDFCDSCDNGLNKTWFDLSPGAFSRLAPLKIGQFNVKWRRVTSAAINPKDVALYPVYPTS